LGTFAQHFRVIAPDTRGHGRTLNPSGVQSYATYAENVIALTQALQLEQPLLCGWSDGGITASLVGIMAPDLPRAIVNLAGFDLFNPDPELPTRRFVREWLGGASQATRADVAAGRIERHSRHQARHHAASVYGRARLPAASRAETGMSAIEKRAEM
jgi:pimeloyl-ACP methyl ester carboxylesterase